MTLISTSLGTGSLMNSLFAKEFPDLFIQNIIDDNLVKEIMANNDVIPSTVVRKVCMYVVLAETSGADLVMITCSSISGIKKIAEPFVKVPVLRIDEPMAKHAIRKGDRIKVLATVSSTLAPTMQLILEKSKEQGKKIVLESSLCDSARKCLDEGNPAEHDRLLGEEIDKALGNFDFVILAQASMARVLDTLDVAKRKRVLTSPPLAVKEIKERVFSKVSHKRGDSE